MKKGKRQMSYVLLSISVLITIFLLYRYFNSTSMSIIKQAVDVEKKKSVIAFTNVNIITMDSEEILKNKTIIIKDGIIQAIGDSEETAIPNDSLIVDGTNKYLIPGLIDMHVHIWSENDILLFLANGITTVRNMDALPWWAKFGGYAEHLSLRNDINSGKVVGPTIYTTGRYFDGNPPEWGKSPSTKIIDNTDSAKKEVNNDKKKGYDYIKVYGNLSLEVYNAILKQAKEEHIKVVGHVPHSVDLKSALMNGQYSIEHLTGYINSFQGKLMISENEISAYAKLTVEKGVWNCPTLVWYSTGISPDSEAELNGRPEMRYVSKNAKSIWKDTVRGFKDYVENNNLKYPYDAYPLAIRMVNMLHNEGAKILVGTDSGSSYVIPGFSYAKELENLVKAGLTNYEALRAGTRDAAECLGKLDEIGTIKIGKKADLVLLDANPLADISYINKKAGVVNHGLWITQTQIDKILELIWRRNQ
jgi:imidazolonepropionase-like amidohydrolase